jgi:PadR family transcriptional regulator, regulatory protein PadR
MSTPVWGFIQPCLLLLLKRGRQHGYGLMDLLGQHGFVRDGDVDVGNLYRTLRRMERVGWVRSEWSEEGPGPVKRVYELTPAGEAQLHRWATGLRNRLDRLGRFLKEYERADAEGERQRRQRR